MKMNFALVIPVLLLLAGCLDKGVPGLPDDIAGVDLTAADLDIASVDATLDLGSPDVGTKDTPDAGIPDVNDVITDLLDDDQIDAAAEVNDAMLTDELEDSETSVPTDLFPEVDDAQELTADALHDVLPDGDVSHDQWGDAEWDLPTDGFDLLGEVDDLGCVPQCEGLECGDNGCDGVCGECAGAQEICLLGVCACIPDCDGKSCGQDGCGGTCGSCGDLPMKCQAGACVCQPQCEGKNCGADMCGGNCGNCEGDQLTCDAGVCTCNPACDGLECGPDGCGGECGQCAGDQEVCFMGDCLCIEVCANKECGGDGCGGSCGECLGEAAQCIDFHCVCDSDCEGKSCGPDGCGNECGVCPNQQDICFFGDCLCIQDCEGRECGDNGCGGLCGVCGADEGCQNHQCVCTPDCTGKQCGMDGCGGTCQPGCTDAFSCTTDICSGGDCSHPVQDFFCLIGGVCVPSGTVNPDNPCEKCKPAQIKTAWSQVENGTSCEGGQVCFDGACCNPLANCLGAECGDDGCGALCGACAGPFDLCEGGACVCQPQCLEKECGPDSCAGNCGDCLGGRVCQDSSCVCVPQFETECCGQDACWLDSCGVSGGIAAECPFGCDGGECQNCTPDCVDKLCGPDGCGGSCGDCAGPQDLCETGLCVCQPECTGVACGPDGCDGSCGICPGPQDACIAGSCICQPDCTGKVCGVDGCGGDCGVCPGIQDACIAGACVCQPECAGKVCGPDGCEGVCGVCDDGLWCTADSCIDGACSANIGATGCLIGDICHEEGAMDPDNACQLCSQVDSQEEWTVLADGYVCAVGQVCYQGFCCNATANCTGKECGADDCGGNCGNCLGSQDACLNGSCVCIPQCEGMECGDDGCGANCGTCNGAQDLCIAGACVCQPECTGHQCGGDGCGGSCGECAGQDLCVNHQCVCQPACDGLECGDDGCGDVCGLCNGAQDLCENGLCVCQPACAGKACGADGCGGDCGTCAWGYKCENHLCAKDPCFGISYEGCCEGELLWWCQNGALQYQKCSDNLHCGWDAGSDFYNCGTAGQADPSGTHPIDCPVCQPDCTGKECGDDGCQGSCGECVGALATCVDGLCQCTPDCTGKLCGDDSCGGSCGTCPDGLSCVGGKCLTPGSCNDGNTVDWDGCTGGTVTEFQVNATCAKDQMYPDVAVWDSDMFAIAWQTHAQDGDDWGVYAAVFNSDGSEKAGEFKLNVHTDNKQEFPAVDIMSNGLLIACWQSKDQDGDTYGVYCRRFYSSGVAYGSEFKANSYTSGDQKDPDVAGLKNGYRVVVWEGKGSSDDQGIWARVWDDEGDSEEGQVRVNSVTSNTQENPAVAAFSGGGFVVVWESKNEDGNGEGVYAQRYTNAGFKTGSPFLVNQTTQGNQFSPSVSAYADGRFVVAWQGNSGMADGDGAHARIFSSAGAAMTNEFQLNTHESGAQGMPVVAAQNPGVAGAWQSDNVDNDKGAAIFNLFSEAGVKQAVEFYVNIYEQDDQEYPAIAAFSDNSTIVVWHSKSQDCENYGIFAQRLDATGSRIYH